MVGHLSGVVQGYIIIISKLPQPEEPKESKKELSMKGEIIMINTMVVVGRDIEDLH
jgi:hypothetical protein